MTIFKEAGLPGAAGLLLAFLIVIAGLLRGDGTAVPSAAASLLPLSLPALGALSLWLGARRMLARNARARGLAVVDRLGAVSVICSDQTGTLTENRMTVAVVDVAGQALDMTETMDRSGSFSAARGLEPRTQSALSLTAIGAALCNDAALMEIEEGQFHTVGDSTDGALVTAAAHLGYWKSALEASFPRIAGLPFDPERGRMTTVHDLFEYDPTILAGLKIGTRRFIAFTKGSVEGLLTLSSGAWMDGAAQPMDSALAARIQAAQSRLMQQGMRVLGVAFRLLDELPTPLEQDLEKDLTFLGLFGMVDPPRPGVPEALAGMKAAGIRTVMLTSDAPLAAVETARALGILEPQPAASPTLKQVMTGAQLEKISAEDLAANAEDLLVFARLDPAQKLKIVEAMKARGEVIAVTVDGLSDAPALSCADVGASMGLSGTPSAKESAALVLLDDSFTSLAAAVEEGLHSRGVLRRLLHFSIAGNLGRLLFLLAAPFMGLSLLPPLQLLWLSLITDGLLGLGLSLEQPRGRPAERTSGGSGFNTFGVAVLAGASALGLGAYTASNGGVHSADIVFTFFAFSQIAHMLVLRGEKIPRAALAVQALVFALQMGVLYFPPLARLLGLSPLSFASLSAALLGGTALFIVLEFGRRMLRRLGRSKFG